MLMPSRDQKPVANDEQTGFAVQQSLKRGARYANPKAVLKAAQALSPKYTLTLASVERALDRLYRIESITSATRDITKKNR